MEGVEGVYGGQGVPFKKFQEIEICFHNEIEIVFIMKLKLKFVFILKLKLKFVFILK